MVDPFPIEKLPSLQFGSADGFKDKELEDTFVKTRSIQKFFQDNHSIIVGPMGSGKSAIFKLLKNQSKKMEVFKNRLIVPIDEIIPFENIKKFSLELPNMDEKQVYQFIWKFQITQKISEKISLLPNFPINEKEKQINDFLKTINSTFAHKNHQIHKLKSRKKAHK